MLTIVDYGVGNLASMQNMLKKIGVPSRITSAEAQIESATKIILPGVGAFDTCAAKLSESGLLPVLNEVVLKRGITVLGVCVGMQLFMRGSEEGILPGLGWIDGRIVRFKQELLPSSLKVPHMGWTDVLPAKKSLLFTNIVDARYYFVHSYHAEVVHQEDILVNADYGYRFVSGVERKNILGVQFHPEKSHRYGMKLLENFAKLY